MTAPHDAAVIDAETEHPPDALAVRRPDVPATIGELAALKGEALEIIEARVQIIETLRKASIRATHPEDWLLFRAPEDQGGQTVGYLQDCGCDRVRDLWGIEVFDLSKPEKIAGQEPGIFHYLITGSGRCKISRQVVESMEGGRSSTDDFCKDKTGADLELAVRKAARANLDGNITRELAGLKSVPIEEIARAWSGTPKQTDHCRRGRGFGTKEQRAGGDRHDAPNLVPPTCEHCGAVGEYKTSARGGFYGCPRWKTHEAKKWTVDVKKWEADPRSKPPATQAPAPQPPPPQAPPPPAPEKPRAAKPQPPPTPAPLSDLSAGDIFGPRDPGEEG